MINIGFWNIGLNKKKKCYDERLIVLTNNTLAWFIEKFELDILAVCEFPLQEPEFIQKNLIRERQYEEAYYLVPRLDTRIFYSKQTVSCVSNADIIDEERHCMNRFSSSGIEFNLSCVHLPSKLFGMDDSTRKILVRSMLKCIKDFEKEYDDKTIVVGDFNSDPYESTMLGTDGFHALPDRKYAEIGRTVQGIKFDAFYNPMWNLYGDFQHPVGTHFYNNAKETNQLWYLLDQVIMRSKMIEHFIPESLRIVYEGIENDRGRPKQSDHFPIVFSLT